MAAKKRIVKERGGVVMRYAVVSIRPPLREVMRFAALADACEHIGRLYEPSTYDVFRCVDGGIQQLGDMDRETVRIIMARQHVRYDDKGQEA